MDDFETSASTREIIKDKLRQNFDGKIVRKDLTKKIKEGANVPTYVLEFLLGQYCSSDDDEIIQKGVENVKRILADNYVRPDEAQKILSLLRERGSYTVIDRITVVLNTKEDRYEATFSNLGIKNIPISADYVKDYDRLLCGGIWCILQLDYEFIEEDKKNTQPIRIRKLTPIQMPHVDMDEVKNGRKAFTKEEWMDILLRSTGMEPDKLSDRAKWLLIARMIPLVENNFNMCELGPRSTGKSYIYEQISPNSILVAGGQTTVANLFYNMSNNTVGLVGMWDVVAFDEVAGIKFKDKDGIQIMKGYMASGAFSRGKAEIQAKASMVFVGNINQSVETLQKTSSLFDPFPPEMGTDTAFLDRFHAYIPGWEIPKYRPDSFTNDYGFITDYLSEFMRELRKDNYSNIAEKYFKLGNNLENERFSDKTIEEITRATLEMAKVKTGALMVISRDHDLSQYIETGIRLDARITSQLIVNIFEKNTPLHDGAVIIDENRVVAATCYLPLSDSSSLSKDLGTRHRAGLGLSEVSDCVVIIVSEENGSISIARDGKLIRYADAATLKNELKKVQAKEEVKSKKKKGWRRNEVSDEKTERINNK